MQPENIRLGMEVGDTIEAAKQRLHEIFWSNVENQPRDGIRSLGLSSSWTLVNDQTHEVSHQRYLTPTDPQFGGGRIALAVFQEAKGVSSPVWPRLLE
ncbi:MAG TPA: hypothetical protein VME47_01880 [Acetobacteraceae bacterium]|nr:hypothetical protein [Acetobacteraceae bacterium]